MHAAAVIGLVIGRVIGSVIDLGLSAQEAGSTKDIPPAAFLDLGRPSDNAITSDYVHAAHYGDTFFYWIRTGLPQERVLFTNPFNMLLLGVT